MTRRPASSLLALLALAALAPAAHADGGLSVAPSRIEADVQRGALLGPIRLRNDTGRDLTIRAGAVAAGQRLDGLPEWQPEIDARRRLARVSPAVFTLRAGEAQHVRVRITGRRPLRRRGSYGVVVFSATEAVKGRRSRRSASVGARVRLGANLLLTYPGKGQPRGGASAARAEQAGPRRVRHVVRVRNRGRLHGRPRARLVVRDDRGRVVQRAAYRTGAVLPGAERELGVVPDGVLDAGRYTATSIVDFAGRRTRRTQAFTLTAPNTLPTPDLRISALDTPAPDAGEPVDVDLALRNTGTAPAPIVGVATVGPQAGRADQRLEVRDVPLAPGASRTVPLRFEGVADGAHELAVTLLEGDR
ncbi:MAG TPA: hypothetical protein VD931_04030, partial [Baekduia sp.]|nr:hypothetical protein [Baekduia sp.]